MRKPVFSIIWENKGTDLHILISKYVVHSLDSTVMTLIFRTNRSWQTVQTQIRLLLEQSDQSLHCLLFCLHLFDEIPLGLASLFEF